MTTWRQRFERSAAVVLVVFGASLASSATSSANAQESVIVYAAASLTNAISEVLDLCAAANQPAVIKASFAASSDLAKQIEHGASAAVYLSASSDWMDYLDKRGLLARGSRHRLLSNTLVVIVPAASLLPETISPLEAFRTLPADSRVAMGDPDHVPAGIYAKAALEHIGAWEIVRKQAANTGDVRAALTLVETGAVPIGIVYATDALVSRKVRTVAVFPPESHPPIIYEAALIDGRNTPAVDRLYTCLRGTDAARIFERHGFLALGKSGHADPR